MALALCMEGILTHHVFDQFRNMGLTVIKAVEKYDFKPTGSENLPDFIDMQI